MRKSYSWAAGGRRRAVSDRGPGRAMPRRVFISHSSKDMAAARSICAALEDARIQCWLAPRDIPYTHDFPAEIVGAIAQSWLVLLVLSEHANLSTHIPLEVTQAHEKGIPILPVYIESVTPSDALAYYIVRVQRFEAFAPSLEANLPLLCEIVKKRIEEPGLREAASETSIVVLPFQVLDHSEADAGSVGRMFAEAIAINLRVSKGPTVRTLSEEALAQSSFDLVRIASENRSRWLISGSLERHPGRLSAIVHITDAPLGQTATMTMTTEDPFLGGFASSLAAEILVKLGFQPPKQYDHIDNLMAHRLTESHLAVQAVGAVRRNDVDRAVELTTLLSAAFPTEPEAQALHAFALLLSIERAPSEDKRFLLTEPLATLARLDGRTPYAKVIEGCLTGSEGNPQKAIEILTEVLRRHDLTQLARAWVLRIRARFQTNVGNVAESIKDLQEASRMDPLNVHTKILLSRALSTAGLSEDAVRPAKDAVALDPGLLEAHRTLSFALFRVGRLQESLVEIEKACELGGGQGVHAVRALRLLELGRADDARAEAERTTTMTSSADGCYNLACYYALTECPDEAIALLRRARKAGFASRIIATDPDLQFLHGHPDFEQIVEEIGRIITPR